MNSLQLYIAKLFRIHSDTPSPRPDNREPWKLTLDEWRRQDQMVLESRALSRNLTYRAQMDVMRNVHPVHLVFPATGVSPTDRIVHQAKCEGYELALNNLEAMTKSLKASRPLEATFAAPEETTKRR